MDKLHPIREEPSGGSHRQPHPSAVDGTDTDQSDQTGTAELQRLSIATRDAKSTTNAAAESPGRDNELAYPLSFLLLLVTLTAMFFAMWRVSHAMALVVTALAMPVVVRTVWLVEKQRVAGSVVSALDQIKILLGSAIMVASLILSFAISFCLLMAVCVLAGGGLGALIQGSDGIQEGILIGTIVGMLLSCAGATFSSAWVLHFLNNRQQASASSPLPHP